MSISCSIDKGLSLVSFLGVRFVACLLCTSLLVSSFVVTKVSSP